MTEEITYTMRRYAAEIYRLQEDSEYVGLTDLAEHVDASLQAASRMLRRLKAAGLVEHEPYKGVRLLPDGEIAAYPALRRHRLAEVFLVRVMQFGWDEVHDLTDTFEQGIDDLLEERIFELAGRPVRCPHGEPIPTSEGEMPVLNDRSLVEFSPGRRVRLSRVRVHDPEKLRYLARLGLLPGAEFTLHSLAPFDGPVTLRLARAEVVLSFELGAALFVEPVD